MSAEKLQVLRSSFDAAFAAERREEETAFVNVLAIGLAGDPYAIRLMEISALAVVRKIVPLPASIPELLGLAGFRGEPVPVYDLARLLGYASSPRKRQWLALCGTITPVAVAFDEFEGHFRVPRSAFSPVDDTTATRPHVRETVRLGAGSRWLVDSPSLLEAIRQRARSTGVIQER